MKYVLISTQSVQLSLYNKESKSFVVSTYPKNTIVNIISYNGIDLYVPPPNTEIIIVDDSKQIGDLIS